MALVATCQWPLSVGIKSESADGGRLVKNPDGSNVATAPLSLCHSLEAFRVSWQPHNTYHQLLCPALLFVSAGSFDETELRSMGEASLEKC